MNRSGARPSGGVTGGAPRNAWLVLAVGEDRQHGGNDGYDDSPSRHYSWDSTVPNHAALGAGDFIVLWDKHTLLGASLIEQIDVDVAVKPRYRCPACGRARLKSRKTLTPRFKCSACGHVFGDDEVMTTMSEVVTYRSRHDAAWRDLYGMLDGAELRTLTGAPKSQLSLRRLDWERFRARVDLGWSLSPVAAVDARAQVAAGGHRKATVRVRVGQAAFRRGLLAQYGPCCALTGPAPPETLEAAHLYSFAALGTHQRHGGLLLRSDMHVLFDEGLLAVHPDTGRIDVAESIRKFPAYGSLHGAPIVVDLHPSQRQWLRSHWGLHRAGA